MTFVNRKHSEATLQLKKDINKKSKVFVNHSLCSYYQLLWGKSKELQRKGRINQVFCLGAVVTVKITKNSPAIKTLHEKHLIVCQECAKDYFLFVVIFNFRFYSAYLSLLQAPF